MLLTSHINVLILGILIFQGSFYAYPYSLKLKLRCHGSSGDPLPWAERHFTLLGGKPEVELCSEPDTEGNVGRSCFSLAAVMIEDVDIAGTLQFIYLIFLFLDI